MNRNNKFKKNNKMEKSLAKEQAQASRQGVPCGGFRVLDSIHALADEIGSADRLDFNRIYDMSRQTAC